ncbi:60 kDa SS-A/Ro ribonucleoprotein, partial [Trichinella spiralis]
LYSDYCISLLVFAVLLSNIWFFVEMESQENGQSDMEDEFCDDLNSEYNEYISEDLIRFAMADKYDNEAVNDAGGSGFEVSRIMRLKRFLILGTEGGTFYVSEKQLTKENAINVLYMIENNRGMEVLEQLVEVSLAGRAPKQTATLFCLALCARHSEEIMDRENGNQLRQAAYNALPSVCRIPTHLFEFIGFCKANSESTCWGRSHRRAIANWYLRKNPLDLVYLVTKYKNRHGWTHLDVIRLAHPKPDSNQKEIDDIFLYIKSGLNSVLQRRVVNFEEKSAEEIEDIVNNSGELLKYLYYLERLKSSQDELICAQLIEKFKFVREQVPQRLLSSKHIWQALLKEMPLTATVRTLNRMTVAGLLIPGSEATNLVVERLNDTEALRAARVHPMALLLAYVNYKEGRTSHSRLRWDPEPTVVAALERAFYHSFGNVLPTGKRLLIGLDVSGSMCASIRNTSLTVREASAAMCMIHFRTEQTADLMAFTSVPTELKMPKNITLDKFLEEIEDLDFGATDCAMPMLWALKNQRLYDAFIVYTDCETWAGRVKPATALHFYRERTGITDAKLIVVGMVSAGFTIADPNDNGMLDVVGFDPATPDVMHQFIVGEI